MRLHVVAFLFPAAVAYACGSFHGDDEAGGAADGGDAGAVDGTIDDAPVKDGASRDAPPGATCPVGVGPKMRVVDLANGRRLCVDVTEVTAMQYAQFRTGLSDTAPFSKNVPDGCAALGVGAITAADAQGELPRVNVTFCSAAYFCAAQGKRLCGSDVDGKDVVVVVPTPSDPDPPTEWDLACANGQPSDLYPWGTDDPTGAVGASCLTKDTTPDAGGPRAVGSAIECGPSGSSGPFDMIGNVYEWVSVRRDVVDAGSFTSVRGGAWDVATPGNGCATRHAIDAVYGTYASGRADVGFRCCADPK